MPSVDLQFVGDVILTRRTDPELPFARVAPVLRTADIAFFNNEAPYAASGSPHIYGAVAHDPDCMRALAHAGFHACTFANNHCMGWGAEAMLECADRLRRMGLAVCGVGPNEGQAIAPAIIERKGRRFAFLGYNCIGPKGYMAERDKPGCAMVRIHTHYEPYEYTPGAPALTVTCAYQPDLYAMAENIRRARQAADFVAIYFHWGIHFIRGLVLDYQFEVGHMAVDAGANAVLGCGPHMLKGVEVYKGAPIFYSLGNFCTTRPTPRDRKADFAEGRMAGSVMEMIRKVYPHNPQEEAKSIIARLTVGDGGKLSRVSYGPVLLDAGGAPQPVSAGSPEGADVTRYLSEITMEAGLDTRFQQDGDEVVVLPGSTEWQPRAFAPLVPQ